MATTTTTTHANQSPKDIRIMKKKNKDTMIGFVIGGLAACGAVTFTNPWEVTEIE